LFLNGGLRRIHCRGFTHFNYFQNSTKQTFKGIKTTIKKWTVEERKIIEEHLEKRFKNYKWIETELPARTHLDYAEEIHKVEIPELGINFKYDNQDPLRRPMWIFFK
jgi:hypothetical protein